MKENIKKLRELTGAGIIECQKAVEDAAGDLDKAVRLIRERGYLRAENRKERLTGAGLIHSYIHNERVGVLLELRTETDFAARSADFRDLARNLALQVASMNPKDIEELLEQAYIKNEKMKVGGLINETAAKAGENVRVERFCRYEL